MSFDQPSWFRQLVLLFLSQEVTDINTTSSQDAYKWSKTPFPNGIYILLKNQVSETCII